MRRGPRNPIRGRGVRGTRGTRGALPSRGRGRTVPARPGPAQQATRQEPPKEVVFEHEPNTRDRTEEKYTQIITAFRDPNTRSGVVKVWPKHKCLSDDERENLKKNGIEFGSIALIMDKDPCDKSVPPDRFDAVCKFNSVIKGSKYFSTLTTKMKHFTINRLSVFRPHQWQEGEAASYSHMEKWMERQQDIAKRIEKDNPKNIIRVELVYPIYFKTENELFSGYKHPQMILVFSQQVWGNLYEFNEQVPRRKDDFDDRLELAKTIFYQIGSALDYLHNKFKVTHNNVSTTSIKFICKTDQKPYQVCFKLGDFGEASKKEDRQPETGDFKTHENRGNELYKPVDDEGPYDLRKSDVFSLASVTLTMFRSIERHRDQNPYKLKTRTMKGIHEEINSVLKFNKPLQNNQSVRQFYEFLRRDCFCEASKRGKIQDLINNSSVFYDCENGFVSLSVISKNMAQFEKLSVQNALRLSHLNWLHSDKRNEENIGNPKYDEFMYPEGPPDGQDLIKERPLASLFNLDDRPEDEWEDEKSRRYIEKRLRSESFYFYSEAWRFLSKQIAFMPRPKIECDNSDVYFAGRSIQVFYDGKLTPGTEHFCARRYSIFNKFEPRQTPLQTIAEKILAAKKAFEGMQFVRHPNLVKIHKVHEMFLPTSDKDAKFGSGFNSPYKLIIVEEPYIFDLTDFVRSFGTGQNKAIEMDDTRRIIFQLATGLDYMHRKLLKTHNNLSPKNVVICMMGNFKHSIFKLTNFAWSQSILKKDLNSVNPRKGDLFHLVEIARFLLLGVQNHQRCLSIQEKIGGWTAILPIENALPQDFNRFVHRCHCAFRPIEIITDEYMIGIRGQEYILDCVKTASQKTKSDILLRFKLEKRYVEGLLSSQPAFLLADEFIQLTEHPDNEHPAVGVGPNQYRLDLIKPETQLRPSNLLPLQDDGSLFYKFPKQELYIQPDVADLVKYEEPADYFSCCFFTGERNQFYRIKRISVYNKKRWDRIKKLGFDQINKEMKKWINMLDREMIYNLLIQRHPSPNLLRVHWVLPIYFHETKPDKPGYNLQKPYQVLLFQDYHAGPIRELTERFGWLRNEDIRKFAFQLTCAVRHLHELFKLNHGNINSDTVKFVIQPEDKVLKIQFKLADWKPPPMSVGVYNSLNDAAKEAQEKGDSYWMIKASEIDSGLYQRSVTQIMYQPPMNDDSKIDRRRLDIYAIGCLVAEMNMTKIDPNRTTKSEEAKSEETLEARKEIADLISKSQFNQLVEKGLEPKVVNFVKKACDTDFKKTVNCFDLLSDPFLAKNDGQEPHPGLSQDYLTIDEVEKSADEKLKLNDEVNQQLTTLEETRKWYKKATKN